MNLSTIQNIFQDLATKHKAIKSFYTGLASEFNTDFDLQYPALLVDPVSITKSAKEGVFINNWNMYSKGVTLGESRNDCGSIVWYHHRAFSV